MHSKSTRTLLVLVAVFAMSAVAASSAFAAGAPVAETKEARKISHDEATLRGVVNPNGAETKYWFEWGTSTKYGSKSGEVSVGAGTKSLEESFKAAPAAGATYDFRIVASNGNGTTDGANEVFTTPTSGSLPEFNPVPIKNKFTSTGGTWLASWNNGVEQLRCTASSSTGEVTGARTLGKVTIVLTGCEGGRGTQSCPANSEGAKSGEIVTKALSAELGTVATGEAPSGVGLLYKPEKGKEWFGLEGSCTWEGAVGGTIAQEVAQVGIKQSTNKFNWSTKLKEIKLDSGTVEKPHLSIFEAAIEVDATDTVKFEEAVEVT